MLLVVIHFCNLIERKSTLKKKEAMESQFITNLISKALTLAADGVIDARSTAAKPYTLLCGETKKVIIRQRIGSYILNPMAFNCLEEQSTLVESGDVELVSKNNRKNRDIYQYQIVNRSSPAIISKIEENKKRVASIYDSMDDNEDLAFVDTSLFADFGVVNVPVEDWAYFIVKGGYSEHVLSPLQQRQYEQ
jgi:hypothetical protein